MVPKAKATRSHPSSKKLTVQMQQEAEGKGNRNEDKGPMRMELLESMEPGAWSSQGSQNKTEAGPRRQAPPSVAELLITSP